MSIYLPAGLFVLSSDKETILREIDSVASSFKKALADKEVVAECRACRWRIKDLLLNYFADTRARAKTIWRLENSDTDNVKLAYEYGNQLSSLLYDLAIVVNYSVSFDDLPSCRSLLDCSIEQAQDKAMDLVGNGVVKAVAKSLSIGKEIYHFKEIEDVRRFYSDINTSFINDSLSGLPPTAIEQVFDLKCEEELEYCNLATLKVTGKLTKELLEKGKERAQDKQKHYLSMLSR